MGTLLTHHRIWQALDLLAERHGLSPSGLARRAGLDPTTFNVSKRGNHGGKARWPTTSSIAKVLAATGSNFGELAALVEGREIEDDENPEKDRKAARRIPLIGLAQAGNLGFFDDGGFPVGGGWDQIEFPEIGDPNAYALEISGDSMLPVFRDGDTIIVSPGANIRRGDRVVVKTLDGEVMAKILMRQTVDRIELHSLNPEYEDRSLTTDQILWMARIVWASQ